MTEPPQPRAVLPPASTSSGPAGRDNDYRRVELLDAAYRDLSAAIERVIVGQKRVVDLLLTALFSGGHSILVGVPGLAKTLLVSTLARLLSLSFKRIQFTPDLMPSDITGTDILQEDRDSGMRTLRFLKGPVFTHMLLADEINRTPPKTQAALLEAMQEGHVTAGDRTLELPRPFFVVATQNPIEQEGTYPLPEAQLDRFLFAIDVAYPSEDEELEIIQRPRAVQDINLPVLLGGPEILEIQDLVPRVPAAEHVLRFALQLVRRTRPAEPEAPAYVRDCLEWGAGPRAAQNLVLAAKAWSLVHGAAHTSTEDVEAVAVPVLGHRLVTNFRAGAEGITSRTIVERLVADLRGEARGRSV